MISNVSSNCGSTLIPIASWISTNTCGLDCSISCRSWNVCMDCSTFSINSLIGFGSCKSINSESSPRTLSLISVDSKKSANACWDKSASSELSPTDCWIACNTSFVSVSVCVFSSTNSETFIWIVSEIIDDSSAAVVESISEVSWVSSVSVVCTEAVSWVSSVSVVCVSVVSWVSSVSVVCIEVVSDTSENISFNLFVNDSFNCSEVFSMSTIKFSSASEVNCCMRVSSDKISSTIFLEVSFMISLKLSNTWLREFKSISPEVSVSINPDFCKTSNKVSDSICSKIDDAEFLFADTASDTLAATMDVSISEILIFSSLEDCDENFAGSFTRGSFISTFQVKESVTSKINPLDLSNTWISYDVGWFINSWFTSNLSLSPFCTDTIFPQKISSTYIKPFWKTSTMESSKPEITISLDPTDWGCAPISVAT